VGHNLVSKGSSHQMPMRSKLPDLMQEVSDLHLLILNFTMLSAVCDAQSEGASLEIRRLRRFLHETTTSWSQLRNSRSHALHGCDPGLVKIMDCAFSRHAESVFSCFENMARSICTCLINGVVPRRSELSELVRFVSHELHDVFAELLSAARLVTDLGEQSVAAPTLTDRLTGLPNRRALHDYIHKTELAGWPNDNVSIMQVDLDKFKKVNDTMGHAAGDAALKYAADAFTALKRNEDYIARVGGDEFILVFFGDLKEEWLSQFAEKLIVSMSVPFTYEGKECLIGASVGIARGTKSDDDTLDRYLNNADLALYSAKKSGFGTHRFFTPDLRTTYEKSEETQARIREGLENGQFEPFFQPQVEGRSGKIVGLESLARWNHPSRGLLTPFHFLQAAEEGGLLDRMDRHLMEQTFAAMRLWTDMGYDIPQVSVNLTASRLMETDIVDTILHAAKNAGLDPTSIGVEILESAMIENDSRLMIENDSRLMIENVRKLSESGIKVELDDFGTGHASIANLRHFRVDRIKIDRSFVKDIHLYSELARITSAMISLAHSLRVDALAEGIETPEERMVLNALGCDYIQGFGVARPMPASEIPQWMDTLNPKRQLPPRRKRANSFSKS
jgi:diguanylate cyclase (GGDEF)-like protein